MRAVLEPPRSWSRRRLPLRIAHPAVIRERIRLELPGPPDLAPDQVEVRDEAASLTRRARAEGRAYVVDLEYRSRRPALPPAAVAGHVETLREMRGVAGFDLTLALRRPGQPARGGGTAGWVAVALAAAVLAGGAGLFIVVSAAFNGDLRRWRAAWLARRRQRAFRGKLAHEPGEAPERPLTVACAADARPALARLRCTCGASLSPGEPGAPVWYGDRELLVQALTCARCGAERRAYVALGE